MLHFCFKTEREEESEEGRSERSERMSERTTVVPAYASLRREKAANLSAANCLMSSFYE